MQQQIDYVNNVDLLFDRNEDWKLIGYWPKIMEKVHIIDVNMESILAQGPSLQSYPDTSLYNTVKSSNKNFTVSKRKVEVQQTLPTWMSNKQIKIQ